MLTDIRRISRASELCARAANTVRVVVPRQRISIDWDINYRNRIYHSKIRVRDMYQGARTAVNRAKGGTGHTRYTNTLTGMLACTLKLPDALSLC